jgi:hypothetical protein
MNRNQFDLMFWHKLQEELKRIKEIREQLKLPGFGTYKQAEQEGMLEGYFIDRYYEDDELGGYEKGCVREFMRNVMVKQL